MAVINTPESIAEELAARARARRLALEFTQEGLAKRAGVSYGTLKRFERTGKISLDSLLKIALVLDTLEDFKDLFARKSDQYESLDDILKEENAPKRGKIK